MRARYLTVAGLVASSAISIIWFALSPSITSAQTKSCYPPEYNASGDLLLPRNFHEWIYVGSPLSARGEGGNILTYSAGRLATGIVWISSQADSS
jgi:hypothetical protein